MKIYNSKAQMTTNVVALSTFFIVAFGKINTSQQYCVANYNYTFCILLALIVSGIVWSVLTYTCSKLTTKILQEER